MADETKYENVLVDVDDGVATITMNRPKARNAFNNAHYSDFAAALRELDAREDVKVVIVTGAGKLFSAGADLMAPPEGPVVSEQAPVGQFMLTLHAFSKPIVAAVNGPAIGIGTTMLPHCDVVYAADHAFFWTPFTRIAVVPEFCSTVLFPEVLGLSVANEMLLMGRKLDATTAKARGLISDYFPKDELMPEVMKRVREMLDHTHAGKSVRLFKRMVKEGRRAQLESVIRMELRQLDKRINSGETAEAAMDAIVKMAEAKRRQREAGQSKL